MVVHANKPALLTVLAGPDQSKFIVHKTLICKRSDFFQAACARGGWKEAIEKIVRLPEIDEDIFRIYDRFICHGVIRLLSPLPSTRKHDPSPSRNADQFFDLVVHAYALAEVIQDATFCNALADETQAIMTQHSTIGSACTIETLCEKVSLSSKLTMLFVHKWAGLYFSKTHESTHRPAGKELPVEFVVRIVRVLVARDEWQWLEG
ncbi:hypothetical protein LTR09_011347 [Extremus antarcticus]|uniref:BTB domain-containing protein n=1 Tax=Extremus antarcticus TaxID=702011 RepID=A0AAJ0G523_9PEZI|nr:hypothetical protein LTR09_011347 [Extremus antarcticus]